MSKKAIAVIATIIGVTLFGYIQYASASQISATITNSELLEKSEKGSLYNLELQFNNPSLLVLTAGNTEFTIIADDNALGQGTLDPFMLPALGKATTNGLWLKEHSTGSDAQVKISGVTKYQLLFTSIDIPFTYYPTQDQTREFIHDA
ncbi:MAG: hypothetical protein ACT4NT_04830 [Nitrososphaerota archaeon]